MQDEWLKNYYSECGREISLAFQTMDNNQNWTVTLVSAIIVGIILSGFLPNIWTWSLLVIGLALTIRFFVRTCLAYINLIRWNFFRKKINSYFLQTPENEKAALFYEIKEGIKIYDDQWNSPISKRNLIFANLKYGYYYAFSALILMIVYNLYSIYHTTGFLGPTAMQVTAVGFLGLLVILWEVKGLFDPPFFKHIPSSRHPSINKFKFTKKRILAIIFLFLTFSGVFLAAYTQTETTLISTSTFTQKIGDYSFSGPYTFDVGNFIEIKWTTSQPIGVGLTQISSMLEYNQSKLSLNALSYSSDTQGKLESTIRNSNEQLVTIFVSNSQQIDSTTLILTRSWSPFAFEGIFLSMMSMILLIILVVFYYRKEVKEADKEKTENTFL